MDKIETKLTLSDQEHEILLMALNEFIWRRTGDIDNIQRVPERYTDQAVDRLYTEIFGAKKCLEHASNSMSR